MRRDSLNSSPNTFNKHHLSSGTGRMLRISSPTSQKSYSKQLQRQYPTSTSPSGHNQDLPRNAKTTSKKPRDSNGFGKGRELRKPGRNTRLPGTAKAASSRLSYAKFTETVWRKLPRTLVDSGNLQNGPRTEATLDRASHLLSRDQMAQLHRTQGKRLNC